MKRYSIVHAQVVRLVMFAVTVWTIHSSAQYVELTATIEIFRWGNDGMRQERPWEVQCIVGTNAWQMDGVFVKEAKSSAWFTGTNIVESHELAKPVGYGQRLLDNPDRWVPHAAKGKRMTKIFDPEGGNPSRPVGQADCLPLNGRIAWLAFCSGPYLKREGRKLYPPSSHWKHVVSAPTGFLDRTVVFEDGLGLPKSVRLQTTNSSPVLQYGIAGSTNVCGWEFPLTFRLAQYRPVYSSISNQFGPDGWEIDYIAEGKLTAIRAGTEPRMPPEVVAALNQ